MQWDLIKNSIAAVTASFSACMWRKPILPISEKRLLQNVTLYQIMSHGANGSGIADDNADIGLISFNTDSMGKPGSN